jgi:hypothetical protein
VCTIFALHSPSYTLSQPHPPSHWHRPPSPAEPVLHSYSLTL